MQLPVTYIRDALMRPHSEAEKSLLTVKPLGAVWHCTPLVLKNCVLVPACQKLPHFFSKLLILQSIVHHKENSPKARWKSGVHNIFKDNLLLNSAGVSFILMLRKIDFAA